MEYTIRIEKDSKSGWLVGQCEEIPEAFSQGKDMNELMYMMKDVIALMLECRREDFRKKYANKNAFVRKLRIENEKKSIIKRTKSEHLCLA
ncbi:MAG: type II toxin-antitoxin system HicB family antitoxin [Lentimicrobiaceae bacterium]|nr:type II toxin-antitoxin system HicB family antitoxin [Lentimicrobiaceae bacterium]